MSYNRPPNVVVAGRGLRQNPPPSTTEPPGIVTVNLDANIATPTSLGVVQIGSGISVTPEGIISATGSHTGSFVGTVILTSTSYTALDNDYYIGATSKNITITLPSGVLGQVYVVKNQSTGSVILRGTGGQTIDSASFKTIGSDGSFTVIFDGTRWNIISGV